MSVDSGGGDFGNNGDFGSPSAGYGPPPGIPAFTPTGNGNVPGYYNPSIPNYDAYSRMPVRPGTQAAYGAGQIPSQAGISWQGAVPSGNFATNLGTLKGSFWGDPATQRLVMTAVSNYYGYEVKNLSYGAGFIDDAAQIASASGGSAWDIIRGFASGPSRVSPSSGGGGYGGGGGGATSRVTLTNPDQAKALLDDAMAQALGRGSTEKERADFLKALNAAESANPFVQTVSGTTVTTTGGVDPSVRALEYAEAQQGSAEFKAAGELMSAFVAAIEDPVNI